jgi:2-polyprenyl-6-hydroxyphenyl methylase/3-demethylubiquinone-9 3-methyltransferase
MRPLTEPSNTEVRFAFGENWRNFLEDATDRRVVEAENSLRTMLAGDLAGKSFLDIGCGSGLFSLAAVRLGAERVHSFDYDENSVEATRVCKERWAPDASWAIEGGDVTDHEYMGALGKFDVVYSWGVLHHTGAMWHALENVCQAVLPGGLLFIAIYNDQGRKSGRWRAIKRTYNRLPRRLRVPYAVAVMLPSEARNLAVATVRGRPLEYLRGWTGPYDRGMSRWHDLLDWVGGYPFEVARPEAIFDFCRDRGFVLVELRTAGGGLGNNQYVFRADAGEPLPTDSEST